MWAILQWLLENSLFVKAEKCEFHSPSVSFLGYINTQGSVQMDPAKVSAVIDWPVLVPKADAALSWICKLPPVYKKLQLHTTVTTTSYYR